MDQLGPDHYPLSSLAGVADSPVRRNPRFSSSAPHLTSSQAQPVPLSPVPAITLTGNNMADADSSPNIVIQSEAKAR